MIFILIGVIVVLGVWCLLIYIRKTMWDAVHRNLLDLEDNYEGQVIRRGFASRPFFHGKISGIDITINFSTEKVGDRRLKYIDISYAKGSKFSFSVSSQEWLKKQDAGEIKDYTIIENDYGHKFVARPFSEKEVQKIIKQDIFSEILNQFTDLAYIFAGKSGIICECFSEEIHKTTEFENLNKRLLLLEKLGKVIS